MYQYANALCFSSDSHQQMIICIGDSFYLVDKYKILGGGNNQKQIIIDDIQIVEVEYPKSIESRTKTVSHKLLQTDNLKKIIGSPQQFVSLMHNEYHYNLIWYGRFYSDEVNSITFSPDGLAIKLSDIQIFDKYCQKINIEDIIVTVTDKEAIYKPFENKLPIKCDNIIVTLTSPHRDIPSLDVLEKSLSSIRRFSFFSDKYSVIIADGIKKDSRWNNDKDILLYEQYLKNIKQKIDSKETPFNNTLLIESAEWNGPTRNLEKAISVTQADTVFLNQHDLWFDEHDGVRQNNYGHLQEDKIEKDLYEFQKIITNKSNDVEYIVFPRYWEIARRPCICGSGIRYINCCDDKNNGNDYKELYDKKRIKSENLWWFFTNKDYIDKDIDLYSVDGISDAQAIASTDFVKKLIEFGKARNPNRFIEDILHSQMRNKIIENISGHIFLYQIFCCFHINLRSKEQYLGQGVDEY